MEVKELMSIESSGKSVDEAIFKGLQQMGISIDEVSIEIIQTETKGILGIGAKPAKVRLTQRSPEEYEVPDYMKRAEERSERRRERNDRGDKFDRRRDNKNDRREKEARRPERDEKPAKPFEKAVEEKPETAKETDNTAEMKAERPQRDNRPRREARPEPAEAPVPEEITEPAPAKKIEYSLEEAKGNPAAEFVKGLIERMGAEGQVLAAKDEECLRLRIDSEMMGMLIGHRGETLDAMQYLTGLVVNKNRKTEGYTRVTLNTEEYREKREETLRRLARKVAGQVRATGRPRALEPMNPYERRVLHSALQNNPDVTTHSEGEEPNRRVVVTPRRKGGFTKSRGRRNRSGYRRSTETASVNAEMASKIDNVVENIENSVENAD